MLKTCNVCGNRLISRFPRILDPITNKSFAIHKCSRCGLGHTVPQPKKLSHYYGSAYYGNRHGFTSMYCTCRRLSFLASAMDAGPGRRLLDVGCGDGSFLLGAKNAGWEVTGTEIDPKSAQSLDLDVKESIDQLSDASLFDCITMWHSLEHMHNIKNTLSKLSQMLKPNGKLIVAVPDNGGLQSNFFRHKWIHLDVPRHLYHFDAASLSFCLENAGFELQNQWHQELEYDLIGWSQSALNCFFPPNIFFDYLTGKAKNHNILLKISNFVLGLMITSISLPAVVGGTLLNRGGTLISVARPSGNIDFIL